LKQVSSEYFPFLSANNSTDAPEECENKTSHPIGTSSDPGHVWTLDKGNEPD
jgi:hypothetical protein